MGGRDELDRPSIGREAIMNRAILYSRVSSGKQQDGISLEMQVMDMVSYAARMGYTVVGREQDVMTGFDSMNERPGLLRVRQALREKLADIVNVWKSDRLSRDMADALMLQKELVQVGARLESATEGAIEATPLGKFLMAARTFGAETERASITLRTQTALRRYAEAGRILASRQAKFGWQFTYNEKHKAVGYALHEENASVMKRAYTLVDSGLSLARICKTFNDESIPTPMGKGLWNRACLWSMLRDESYRGDHAAYRRTQVKRQVVVNGVVKTVKSMVRVPESEVIHQSIPAIVDRDLWARVNARMPQNKSESTRHNRDVDLPLLRAGFGFCAYCHHPMYGNSTYRSGFHVYQCSHRPTQIDDKSQVCPGKAFSLKAVDVDTEVWAAVCEIAKDKEKVQRLVSGRRRELETAGLERRPKKKKKQKILEESTRQQANLAKRIAREDDDGIAMVLRQELGQVNDTIKQLNARILRASTVGDIYNDFLTLFQETHQRFIVQGVEAITYDEKREVLRMLGVRVEMYRADSPFTLSEGRRWTLTFGTTDYLLYRNTGAGSRCPARWPSAARRRTSPDHPRNPARCPHPDNSPSSRCSCGAGRSDRSRRSRQHQASQEPSCHCLDCLVTAAHSHRSSDRRAASTWRTIPTP